MSNNIFKSGTEIKNAFLTFFESHDHKVLPGSQLVLASDPTLLFANAGMNQFKEIFLGHVQPLFPLATTAQWCLRAGGKHNDLENVGFTARHHTLFQMLGNFSFGKYSKRDAIALAWKFLTDLDSGLGISPKRLWVTVYAEDKETLDIWKSLTDFDKKHLVCIGDNPGQRYESDNFWKMGDVGPCGPSTEIFYDYGEAFVGTPPGPNQTGERFVEIWNIVFMQFTQNTSGEMTPLKKLGIDTGMGLERIAAVLQNTQDNYQTDIFLEIIAVIARYFRIETDPKNTDLRVIADHIRAIIFLLHEEVIPENQGRGYVLRRIIRRAALHAYRLGAQKPALFKLVSDLYPILGKYHKDLVGTSTKIEDILQKEEAAFYKTLEKGLCLFEEKIKNSQDKKNFSGFYAFELYDTYGFPLDITEKLCKENELLINLEEFQEAMQNQKNRSRLHHKFAQTQTLSFFKDNRYGPTKFLGYEYLDTQAKILAIFDDQGQELDEASAKEHYIILDKTVFYPEGGGQIGDSGMLTHSKGSLEIINVQKIGETIVHIATGALGEPIKKGSSVSAKVDSIKRQSASQHHSCVHLLHYALQEVLGKSAVQAGSSVGVKDFRFDFRWDRPLSVSEINTISKCVNNMIQRCLPVTTELCDLETARKKGAQALFEKKYKEKVRVVSMGASCKEVCGGTHVTSTGAIGYFQILSETGLSKGIRRIEGCAGSFATEKIMTDQNTLCQLERKLKCSTKEIDLRVDFLLDDTRKKDKELKSWKMNAAQLLALTILNNKLIVPGYYCQKIDHFDREFLQEAAQILMKKDFTFVVFVGKISKSNKSLEIFCQQNKTIENSLLEKFEKFLEKMGSLKGGGPFYQKIWTITTRDFLAENQLIEKILNFLNG